MVLFRDAFRDNVTDCNGTNRVKKKHLYCYIPRLHCTGIHRHIIIIYIYIMHIIGCAVCISIKRTKLVFFFNNIIRTNYIYSSRDIIIFYYWVDDLKLR